MLIEQGDWYQRLMIGGEGPSVEDWRGLEESQDECLGFGFFTKGAEVKK